MTPNPLANLRGWIFDLDGTLTRPQHDFAAMRRDLGIPAGEPILEYIASRPVAQRMAMNHRLDRMERAVAEQAVINSGADLLVKGLADSGCLLGIFTRNRRDCVEIALQRIGLRDFFAARHIIACDDALPKPDPAGIRLLLDRWRLPASAVAMVGDFRYDLEAGRAVGCYTIHLADKAEESWPALTDLRVSSLSQLIL